MESKGRSSVSRLTRPGRVEISRRRYAAAAAAGSGSLTPLDAALDVANRAISVGVAQLACRLALDAASFRRAGQNLWVASGLRISAETLRQVVESEGKAVAAAQEAEQLELDWTASQCLVLEGQGQQEQVTTRLYLGCDGVLVATVTDQEKARRRAKAQARRRGLPGGGKKRRPLPPRRRGTDQRYKEMKLVTLYDQRRQRRLVRVTRKDHRQAGKLMRQGLTAVRARGAQQRIALIDGAPWISKQVGQRQPRFTAVTLDFWHLSEHVHQMRREVFGENDPQGQTWTEDLLRTLRDEGYEPFWEKLSTLKTQHRKQRARQALSALMHYVAPRREMLNYPQHQRHGWDIGSGPTESMCKVLSRRVKGSGKRWDLDSIEAMMTLEGLLQSNLWTPWWTRRFRGTT